MTCIFGPASQEASFDDDVCHSVVISSYMHSPFTIELTSAIYSHDHYRQLKAWFRKVEQLKRVSVLFDLFAVQLVHSQNHVWLRNVTKNDVTVLNKFLLIVIFAKTCIKALHMRHNNCNKKIMHIFIQKRINYGHVRWYAYACSHICLRLIELSWVEFASAETALEAGWLVRQTQLKRICVRP